MSVRTEIPLWGAFNVAPTDLIHAQQRVPMELGRIPLFVFDRKFTVVEPILEPVERKLGGAVLEAVRFSLPGEKSFGFMMEDDGFRMLESQKTDGLVLSPDPEVPGAWVATLNTPDTLTFTDERLFNNGIEFYVQHASQRLSGMQQPRA
jgi:hypothetical protein